MTGSTSRPCRRSRVSSSGFGATPTSVSRSTARSAPCGPASWSARSAIGSTRSRWPTSCTTRPTRRSPSGRSSSSPRVPNLLFSPIAGAFVDRWDHREVMIVSDLLRAGLVLLIPLAAVTNLALAYPLVFLVTTVSIFFRPAKGAILPRIVDPDDLVPANSALWVGETFADIGGYLIAGLFVGLLGTQLPLAFWVDSVTYIASALLIASIAVAPVGPRGRGRSRRCRSGDREGHSRRIRDVRLRDRRGLALPPRRDGPPREHAPGRGGPVHARDPPRAHPGLRGEVARPRRRHGSRGVRLPRGRDRGREPGRRVRDRAHREPAGVSARW